MKSTLFDWLIYGAFALVILLVVGACGVHVAPYSVDGEQVWTLTHIPTGRAIVDRPVADARAVAEALASGAGALNTTSATRARKVCAGVIGE